MIKNIITNDYLKTVVRVFLGMVFLVASVDKVADPDAFAIAIVNYKLVSSSIGVVLATILPWIELLCGLALVFGITARSSSLLIFLLMLVFTGAVISGLVRGLDISCGCFTKDPSVGRIGWLKVAENIGLLILTGFVFYSSVSRFSLERYITARAQNAEALKTTDEH